MWLKGCEGKLVIGYQHDTNLSNEQNNVKKIALVLLDFAGIGTILQHSDSVCPYIAHLASVHCSLSLLMKLMQSLQKAIRQKSHSDYR